MEIKLIIDLQYGSTGKGLLAGYLAKRWRPDLILTAWGANAGHTFIDNNGNKYVHTMLANGVVSPSLKKVLLGPGSIINLANLHKEVADFKRKTGREFDVMIHENAAIILPEHAEIENETMTAIGSTKKGVGEAVIQRIRRNPTKLNNARSLVQDFEVLRSETYLGIVNSAKRILVEGAQGYGLSMYHGMYPYTTSRDVTPAQIFADVGLPINYAGVTEIIGTLRSYPIRVSNRYDEQGGMVGFSGGCYPDQHEIKWSDIGLLPELTTVTKLPRRIFTFSKTQIIEALAQCSARTVFVNFLNYCQTFEEMTGLIDFLYQQQVHVPFLGFGATENDIFHDTDQLEVLRAKWLATNSFNNPMLPLVSA